MGKVIVRGAAVRQQAVDMLRNGFTIEQAAAATGFGTNYVRQLGAKEGIRFRKSKIRKDLILKLYEEGLKPKQITERIGAKSPATVYSVLHENGIRHKKIKTIYAYEMRFCKECNTAFLCDPRSNKLFCSDKCQRANSHKNNDIIRRTRRKSVIVDDDISLIKLCGRDHCNCYICGERVDWNDYQIISGKKFAKGKYPTIDHIIPLSRGGQHSWENVRLAHFSCNASKGVKQVG